MVAKGERDKWCPLRGDELCMGHACALAARRESDGTFACSLALAGAFASKGYEPNRIDQWTPQADN